MKTKYFNYLSDEEVSKSDIKGTKIYFNDDQIDIDQFNELNRITLKWYHIINGRYSTVLTCNQEDMEDVKDILAY